MPKNTQVVFVDDSSMGTLKPSQAFPNGKCSHALMAAYLTGVNGYERSARLPLPEVCIQWPAYLTVHAYRARSCPCETVRLMVKASAVVYHGKSLVSSELRDSLQSCLVVQLNGGSYLRVRMRARMHVPGPVCVCVCSDSVLLLTSAAVRLRSAKRRLLALNMLRLV